MVFVNSCVHVHDSQGVSASEMNDVRVIVYIMSGRQGRS